MTIQPNSTVPNVGVTNNQPLKLDCSNFDYSRFQYPKLHSSLLATGNSMMTEMNFGYKALLHVIMDAWQSGAPDILFSAIQKRKPNLKAFTIFRNSGLLYIAKPNFSNDKKEIGVACLQLIEQEAALILTLAEVALAWKKARKPINELILKNKCKVIRRVDNGFDISIPEEYQKILRSNSEVLALWICLGRGASNNHRRDLTHQSIKKLIALKSSRNSEVKRFGDLIERQYVVSKTRTAIEDLFTGKLTRLPYRFSSWERKDHTLQCFKTLAPHLFFLTKLAKQISLGWLIASSTSQEKKWEYEDKAFPRFVAKVKSIPNSYFEQQKSLYKVILDRLPAHKGRLSDIDSCYRRTLSMLRQFFRSKTNYQEKPIRKKLAKKTLNANRKKTIPKQPNKSSSSKAVQVQEPKKNETFCTTSTTTNPLHLNDTNTAMLVKLSSKSPFFHYTPRVKRWFKVKSLQDIRNFWDQDKQNYLNLKDDELKRQLIHHSFSPLVDRIFNTAKNRELYTISSKNGFSFVGEFHFVGTDQPLRVLVSYGIDDMSHCYHRHARILSEKDILYRKWEAIAKQQQAEAILEKSYSTLDSDLSEGFIGDELNFDPISEIYSVTDKRNKIRICVLPLHTSHNSR